MIEQIRIKRADEGHWTARLCLGDRQAVDIDRRYGSWQATVGQARRDVLPAIAAAVQEKVRREERRERRMA